MKKKKNGSSRRRTLFHSMKHQILGLFVLAMAAMLAGVTLLNSVFLEKYYVSQKVKVLEEARTSLAQVDLEKLVEQELESTGMFEYDEGKEEETEEDSAEDDSENESQGHEPKSKEERGRVSSIFGRSDEVDAINRDSSRNNLSWVIINEDNSVWYGWGENEKWLRTKLFGYIYELDIENEDSSVIKKTEYGTIQQVGDRFADMEYVEYWGCFDNGCYFMIRTPLESIQESAAISNKFYLFTGLLAAFVSGILILIFSGRMTRPISELTTLSKQMADLNFDRHYESHVGNEIDVLGESFNRMSDQLESTISELKTANLELQKDIENKIMAEEKRKEFLDNVSHELKTPIALIQGYAEGLKDNITEDPESREFYCDVIIDEAGKMNKLVKNLLTLNQLESGKDPVTMERFDLVQLISGVLQSMDIMIQQQEAKVVFDDSQPVYVWADEFKTEQVLTNYISNAIHHIEGEKLVEIRMEKEDSRIKVSVFNTGKPIPEEDIANLWQKFYKVDKARTREYGGNGIGLSIVKAVMEGMGQEYGVQNYDNGVSFWFTLDLK